VSYNLLFVGAQDHSHALETVGSFYSAVWLSSTRRPVIDSGRDRSGFLLQRFQDYLIVPFARRQAITVLLLLLLLLLLLYH
jgi:hypothetical protein